MDILDNLRNQERLSLQEEERIDRITRIAILVMTGVVVAVILCAVFMKLPLGTWYYALILTLLAVIWLVKDVLSGIWKHALAQRTDEQVSAYLKAAGLDLVSYAGLAWFLVAMSGNGIFGAVVYLFGVTGARKQRELYYQEPEQEEETPGQILSPEGTVMDAQAQAAVKPGESSAMDALPSAANRELREMNTLQTPTESQETNAGSSSVDKEDQEDGSV